MRGKKAVAGALSALMISMSVPVPAIAEGVDEAQPAAIEQAAGEKETAENTTSDAAPEQAADKKIPATQAASDSAEKDAAAAPETVDDAEDPARDVQDEQEVDTAVAADASDTAAGVPATQAAGDPYETEAPGYTTADLARIYGSVSYRVNNGSANSISVVSANNFARVGKPMKNNETGGWRIIATLKADGTADDYGLKSWELGGADPASLRIDEDASDLTIAFETSNASDDSWGVAANRASLVFTAEEQRPTQPGQPGITDVLEAPATINYTLKNAEGGTYDAAVAIGSDERMANISSVYWSDALSAWAVDVTLQQFSTPADYGIEVPAFFAGEYELDADASTLKTTLVYQDGSWVRSYGSTAKLVFAEKVAPAPTTPFNIDDVLDEDSAVHYYANGVLHATSIGSADNVVSVGKPVRHDSGRKSYWSVDVTIRGAGTTAADYDVPTGYLGNTDPSEWAYDESEDNDLTTTFVLYDGQSSWTEGAGCYALLHFKHEVPAPSADDIAGMWGVAYYTLRNEDGSEAYTVTTQTKADDLSVGAPYLVNGAWKVDITIDALTSPSDYGITLPGWYSGQYKLNSKDSKLTFTMTRNADGEWTANPLDAAKLVFDPVAAPAFDINNELNVTNMVRYQLNKADGTRYENSTHLVSADNIASVRAPYQTEDGCWVVDVTLKADATPDGYEVPNWALGDGTWKLDADESDLTLTFRTLTPEGTTWYCSGNDRALLVFTEKTEAENPGTTTPGEDVGTGDDVENPEGNEGAKDPSDAEKPEGASDGSAEQGADKQNAAKQHDGEDAPAQEDEDKLAQTGDPLNGLVAIAAAGTITLVAGIELKRRNERDAR